LERKNTGRQIGATEVGLPTMGGGKDEQELSNKSEANRDSGEDLRNCIDKDVAAIIGPVDPVHNPEIDDNRAGKEGQICKRVFAKNAPNLESM